jgi:hypothetical protein
LFLSGSLESKVAEESAGEPDDFHPTKPPVKPAKKIMGFGKIQYQQRFDNNFGGSPRLKP